MPLVSRNLKNHECSTAQVGTYRVSVLVEWLSSSRVWCLGPRRSQELSSGLAEAELQGPLGEVFGC